MPRPHIILLVLLLCGCPGRESDLRQSAPENADTLSRIAVMAPSAAEMVAALGLAEQVVAIGDHVFWPPELAKLPRIGAYNAPNAEAMLSLRVELFVTSAGQAQESAHRRLEELGIRVMALPTDTFEAVLESFLALGQETGRAARAEEIIGSIRRQIGTLREQTSGLPGRRVLCVVDTEPLYVAGPGSYLHELIEVAGGTNIFADAGAAYQVVSLETALERQPEVILNLTIGGLEGAYGRAAGYWGRWDFLPAVQTGEVWWVHPQRLAVPGPRMPLMAEIIARLTHPVEFGRPLAEELGPLATGGPHGP